MPPQLKNKDKRYRLCGRNVTNPLEEREMCLTFNIPCQIIIGKLGMKVSQGSMIIVKTIYKNNLTDSDLCKLTYQISQQ